jgi:FkbM family methyltransferase
VRVLPIDGVSWEENPPTLMEFIRRQTAAVGRQSGSMTLNVNLANPTVSTVSADFMAATAHAPGWEGQVWSKRVQVPLTTIDALTLSYGRPAFIKIDVEGFEAKV